MWTKKAGRFCDAATQLRLIADQLESGEVGPEELDAIVDELKKLAESLPNVSSY